MGNQTFSEKNRII